MAEKSRSTWLPYLDGWRGLSVIAVLIGHFLPLPFINAGRLGVEMFFCLSGRLMADILFVRQTPLKPFLLRRMSRIWPALWAFVLITTLWFSATSQIGWPAVAGALTFTENYVSILGYGSKVLEHTWSLAIEEWSYILLAIVTLLCRSRRINPLPSLIILIIATAGLGIFLTLQGQNYYEVYWRTDVRISSILIPCSLYLALKKRKIPAWAPLVCGIVGIILNSDPIPNPVKYTIGTALISFCICSVDMTFTWIRSLLSWQPLRVIGLWSFSIYLWQQPFTVLDNLHVALKLASIFCLAASSYYFIEQPARMYLNRRIAGRKDLPPHHVTALSVS